VNPIVEELEAAAKRGVRVRVLLNDEAVFAQAPTPAPGSHPKGLFEAPAKRSRNLDTVCRLQNLAKSAKLAIEGRIVNVKRAQITYIHNKGIVVDGNKAWVSSINGTQNSVQNNREVALAIHSADAAKYFDLAFRTDWTASQSPSASDCQVTSPTP
jgi:phosphatidylserine/phosphatidylglycerophosphate/cardiolipin synthase-like enzyme